MLKAKVYWNFHRKCFSVQVNGRVVAHATRVELFEPRFRVGRAGRERVRREHRKNVHAFIYGNLISSWSVEGRPAVGTARYNPYWDDTFVDQNGHILRKACLAVCEAQDGHPEVRWLDLDEAGDHLTVRWD